MSPVWLDNGLVRLGFVPALGGWLLSVQWAGGEFLWRNASCVDSSLLPVDGHVFASNSSTPVRTQWTSRPARSH